MTYTHQAKPIAIETPKGARRLRVTHRTVGGSLKLATVQNTHSRVVAAVREDLLRTEPVLCQVRNNYLTNPRMQLETGCSATISGMRLPHTD